MKNPIAAVREVPPEPWLCDLVSIDTPIVPYVLTALYWRSQKFLWNGPEAARLARHALAEQGASILMGCKSEILYEQRRLYRLMEGVYYGTSYTDTGVLDADGLPIITPAVPVLPPEVPIAPSMLTHSAAARNFLASIAIAESNDDASDTRNIRDQLDTIITALEAGDSLDPEILAELIQIAALLA